MVSRKREQHKYCTFWYPTIFHRELTVVPEITDRKILSRDIDDGSNVPYLVSLELDKDDNLIVKSKLKDNEDTITFSVTFTKLKSSRNGFCQYRYNTEEIQDGKVAEFEDLLIKSIYHIAKEFYHTHEADSGKDSALKGRITSEEVNLSEDNNEHLIGFLNDYAMIFEDYAKTISDTNALISRYETTYAKFNEIVSGKKKEVEDEDIKRVESLLKELMKQIKKTNKYCENALIEYTYCKTLLNSRYNKFFHHRPLIDEYICLANHTGEEDKSIKDLKNDCRIKALNIESAISYIQNIYYKNQNRLHSVSHLLIDQVNNTAQDVNSILSNINKILDKSEYTGKLSRDLSFFGLIIGLIFGISALIPKDEFAIFNNCISKNASIGGIILFSSVCFLARILYLNNKYKKRKDNDMEKLELRS